MTDPILFRVNNAELVLAELEPATDKNVSVVLATEYQRLKRAYEYRIGQLEHAMVSALIWGVERSGTKAPHGHLPSPTRYCAWADGYAHFHIPDDIAVFDSVMEKWDAETRLRNGPTTIVAPKGNFDGSNDPSSTVSQTQGVTTFGIGWTGKESK